MTDTSRAARSNSPGHQPHATHLNRISIWAIAFLFSAFLFLRFFAEQRMMHAHGPDAQMGFWTLVLFVQMTCWFLIGLVSFAILAMSICFEKPPYRRLPFLAAGAVFAIAWLLMIGRSSWQCYEGGNALYDARDPQTSPDRLEALAQFDGFQVDHQLDNFVASNPNTPETTLRFLAMKKAQEGTLISIAVNPSTPDDLFKETVAELRKYRWYPHSEVDRIVRQREETIAKRLDPQRAELNAVTP